MTVEDFDDCLSFVAVCYMYITHNALSLMIKEHNREAQSGRVPLVITYNPALRKIPKILHNKQPRLRSSDRCKEIRGK